MVTLISDITVMADWASKKRFVNLKEHNIPQTINRPRIVRVWLRQVIQIYSSPAPHPLNLIQRLKKKQQYFVIFLVHQNRSNSKVSDKVWYTSSNLCLTALAKTLAIKMPVSKLLCKNMFGCSAKTFLNCPPPMVLTQTHTQTLTFLLSKYASHNQMTAIRSR